MKKTLVNKRIKIIIIAVVALFIIIGIVIPYSKSVAYTNNSQLERVIKDLFEYPDIEEDSIEDFVEDFEEAVDSKRQKEKFDDMALDAISNMNGGATSTNFERVVYEITAAQILLEAADYKNETLDNAFTEKSFELLELHHNLLDFEDFSESIINEPYPTFESDAKVYDVDLTYYTSPRTLFINAYIPTHLNTKKDGAFSTKDTKELLSLCYDLSVLSAYPDFDITQWITLSEITGLLCDGAETIIVRNGEGGYYDDKENSASSNYKKDEALSVVGKAGTSSVKTSKYFGDLASYYSSKTGSYSWKDDDGNTNYVSDDIYSNSSVYLKDEEISGALSEQYLKYAQEDGMANYYKDDCCFAISDSGIVCYFGQTHFLLDFNSN